MLVTIDKWEVKADRVLLYDPKLSEVNVIKAVHLYNNTNIILTNGQISVMQNGKFVSQNMFTPMQQNDDQIVPYGYLTIKIKKNS